MSWNPAHETKHAIVIAGPDGEVADQDAETRASHGFQKRMIMSRGQRPLVYSESYDGPTCKNFCALHFFVRLHYYDVVSRFKFKLTTTIATYNINFIKSE